MTEAEETHRCDESCACPIHNTQMYYAPAHKKHACQNITCRYAHGFEDRYIADFIWARYMGQV